MPPGPAAGRKVPRKATWLRTERRTSAALQKICPIVKAFPERHSAWPVSPDSPFKEIHMATRAEGKTLAILAADGFEEAELFSPKEAMEAAGVNVQIVSLRKGGIQGMRHMEKGRTIEVDRALADADPKNYDAVLIPGGLFSPDRLRTERDALKFVGAFVNQRKPVFAICHGPQVLISAGLVDGREMTAVKAVRADLANAGAKVKDEAVVTDNGLVTSRTPDDLPAFNKKIVEEISEGAHDKRHPHHYTWALI
jgi:protease I